jgi:hypothetical protein
VSLWGSAERRVSPVTIEKQKQHLSASADQRMAHAYPSASLRDLCLLCVKAVVVAVY